jgi:acyl-CoA synthetase
VIIRGGENISAIEVEEALLALPEVAEAVVVAAPDERFGERVVAVLRVRPGQQMPTRESVREHFQTTGMARQKWPEELREIEGDYPRTASGKVQKYLVRQQVRSSNGEEK